MNLIDFFYRKYNSTFNRKNKLLKILNYNKIIRLLYVILLNIFSSLYFKHFDKSGKIDLSEKYDHIDYIISLTSFPLRIKRLWLVIESLLRQSVTPKEIHLWLSEEQFSSKNELPQNLLSLQEKGLNIHICDGDLKSHKKYYYAFNKFPNKVIITVDDDIFYSSDAIKLLLDSHLLHPRFICANRCALINNKIPYNSWSNIDTAEKKFGYNLMPTGCAGVLYPPNSLYKDLLKKNLIKELCLYGDDLWLNTMGYLNGTKTVYTGYNKYLLPVLYLQNSNLYSANTGPSNLNDIQINAIKKYYKKEINIDVFKRK